MSDKKSTEIIHVKHDQDYAIMPVMDMQAAHHRREAIVEFVKGIMDEGTDYGIIPGTDKPALFKPGAEKLTTFFGLSPVFDVLEKKLDWTGDQHGGEPLFYFQYRCSLHRGEILAGQGVGSCNSWEKKYRFRTASPICPNCGQETVIKGKEEYGGGWLCWQKKGGCGAKWPDGAEEIEGQERGIVKNDNPQDLVNTIDKMAQKRSLIAATLIAVNASEFFTQDLEDMDLGTVTTPTAKNDQKKPDKKQATDHIMIHGKNIELSKLRQDALMAPVEINEGIYRAVCKRFGIDKDQSQSIYAELGNWADALIYVLDNFGKLEEAK